MASMAIYSITLLALLTACMAEANYYFPPRFFNVLAYGAVADGQTDNTQAFLRAWHEACQWQGKSRVYIPRGTFKLGPVAFEGPCRGPIGFILKGVLKAPSYPTMSSDNWIAFRYLVDLVIKGHGYLDGQGHSAWRFNDCSRNRNCRPLPVVVFTGSFNVFLCIDEKIAEEKQIDSILARDYNLSQFKICNFKPLQCCQVISKVWFESCNGEGRRWETMTPSPRSGIKSLKLDFVSHSRIHHLHSINSKNAHIHLFACSHVNISHVKLSAPGDSPNTDGIKLGESSNIKISKAAISTGDDCIAMITGTHNVDISEVYCGPGHGISIGSLGKSTKGEYVKGVNIRNCTFDGTQNGVRIKTWSPSYSSVASDIFFDNIYMRNVYNPILIDQLYCPVGPCASEGQSKSQVQIQNVSFRNIWGTSSSKVAVHLRCSALKPCKNILLQDINLVYRGHDGPATSVCHNVAGKAYGRLSPPGCL